jgi:hypothetical protein
MRQIFWFLMFSATSLSSFLGIASFCDESKFLTRPPGPDLCSYDSNEEPAFLSKTKLPAQPLKYYAVKKPDCGETLCFGLYTCQSGEHGIAACESKKNECPKADNCIKEMKKNDLKKFVSVANGNDSSEFPLIVGTPFSKSVGVSEFISPLEKMNLDTQYSTTQNLVTKFSGKSNSCKPALCAGEITLWEKGKTEVSSRRLGICLAIRDTQDSRFFGCPPSNKCAEETLGDQSSLEITTLSVTSRRIEKPAASESNPQSHERKTD